MKKTLWILVLSLLITAVPGPATTQVWADPIATSGELLLPNADLVRFCPPTLVDINHDGMDEILVGTYDGKVFALRQDGASGLAILWSHDTTADMGGPTTIRGAISAADLEGDGDMELVVPVGGIFTTNTHGGVLVLEASNGATVWVYHSYDHTGMTYQPDGWRDGVVSSPGLGDLDNDGDMEIVFGSFDHRVYALHHDGQMVSGWPKFVRDTVWPSPALADMDNDGFLDIVIGVDTHQEGAPFNTPNGGGIYVYHGDGRIMAGWPKFIEQTIYSSPAVGDLDGDGDLEIVHGTGDNFNRPAAGYRVYAWDHQGNQLWTGSTGGYTWSSPALGDIDGDGKLETVIGSQDKYLYAWNHDGSLLWKTMPTNFQGLTMKVGSPVLADYTGDGIADVFINTYWDAAILDGPSGQQLTASFFPGDSSPAYVSGYTASDNSSALGDIDGDGLLELVVASGNNSGNQGAVFYWDLNTAATEDNLPWPMFSHDARHLGVHGGTPELDATVVSYDIPQLMSPLNAEMMPTGSMSPNFIGEDVQITMRNTGTRAWRQEDGISLSAVGDSDPLSGDGTRIGLEAGEVIEPGQTKTFNFTLNAPEYMGYYTTDWRMVDDVQGRRFGATVAVEIKGGDQPAVHVLSREGLYAGGMADTTYPDPNNGFWNWPAAKVWKLTADQRGYHMFDSEGGYWWAGDIYPHFANSPVSGLQDMVLGPDGISYYELLSNGTIYRCDPDGCRTIFSLSPAISGSSARSVALTPDGSGVYVLDAFGQVHTGGNAPALNPAVNPAFSNDIARRIKLTADGQGYYVLDTYGRVWNGGNAPVLAPRYDIHEGEDWARDLELTHNDQGFYILDKEGGIHAGGGAAELTVNLPPQWPGQDMAVDLEVTDSRALGTPQVSVSDLQFVTGSNQPKSETIEITTSDGQPLSWTASVSDSWIESCPSEGTAPAPVIIRVNPEGLTPGEYEGSILIETATGLTTVVVRAHISENFSMVYLPMLSK